MLRAAAGIVAVMLMAAASAAAQTASSLPGPWVLDVDAVTSPVPTALSFYPPLGKGTVLVPTRGYGLGFGGHVYLFTLGPSRVGLGATVMSVRAAANSSDPATSTTEVMQRQRLTMSLRVISPQVSLNFGSRAGWSYLSAGAGASRTTTRAEGLLDGERASDLLRSLNFGGGARWFMKQHLAFGFDVRVHMIGAGSTTPSMTLFAIGAGLSIR